MSYQQRGVPGTFVSMSVRYHDITHARWFRSAPASPEFSSDRIDAEAGIIFDVVMIEEGEAKGHGVHIDSDFVEALVEYDQGLGARGIKARLGHPNASDDTMGTQLGYFRNVRKRKSGGKMQAIADLHLLDTADASPTKPNMRQWVIGMAQEAPDFIMSSIVFRASGFYQRKANGHKKPVKDEMDIDVDLGHVYVEFDPDNGASHFYTDLVEQGAATDNLFSTEANQHLFVARLHRWLDDNPDIRDWVKQHPDKVRPIMHRMGITYDTSTNTNTTMQSIKEWLFGTADAKPATPQADELDTLKSELTDAKKAVAELRAERDEFERKFNEAYAESERLREEAISLRMETHALSEQVEKLLARMETLEKTAATRHTSGVTDDGRPATGGGRYRQNPVYQKALAMSRPIVTNDPDNHDTDDK